MAITPIAGIVAALVCGFLSKWLKRCKELITVSLVLALGSWCMYSVAEDAPGNHGYFLLGTRILLGLSMGTCTVLLCPRYETSNVQGKRDRAIYLS